MFLVYSEWVSGWGTYNAKHGHFASSESTGIVNIPYSDLLQVSKPPSLSSRLDNVDSLHSANHDKAIQKISLVDTQHKDMVYQLGQAVDQVEKLQGKVKESLRELKYFLAGLGKVAEGAAKQLEDLRNNK